MLQFEQTRIDLGNVKHGTLVTRDLSIKNLNDKQITPNVPNSSCSCTSGYVTPSTIPANGLATLKLSFNSAKVGLGNQAKTLNISYSFNGNVHSITLNVIANVV